MIQHDLKMQFFCFILKCNETNNTVSVHGDAVWWQTKSHCLWTHFCSSRRSSSGAGNTHDGARLDAERLQRPGQTQTHQDVKHITAYGVGDGHVSQTWGEERNTVKVCVQSGDKAITTSKTLLCDAGLLLCFPTRFDLSASYVNVPCRATMTLAMQSGTLVPAARKVMPMMTSGMPRVKPITVTWEQTDIVSRDRLSGNSSLRRAVR